MRNFYINKSDTNEIIAEGVIFSVGTIVVKSIGSNYFEVAVYPDMESIDFFYNKAGTEQNIKIVWF